MVFCYAKRVFLRRFEWFKQCFLGFFICNLLLEKQRFESDKHKRAEKKDTLSRLIMMLFLLVSLNNYTLYIMFISDE